MKTQEQISFYQVIQKKFDGYLKHLNVNSKQMVQYITIMGCGFLLGILLKRYGALIVSSVIGILFLITFLNYFNFVIINTVAIKAFFNIEQVNSLDNLFIVIKTRFSDNLVECLIGIFSIVLGFKLG